LILDNVCDTDTARLPAATGGRRGALTTSPPGVDLAAAGAGSSEAADVVAATALTVNLLGTVTTVATAAAPRRPEWPSAAGDDALSAKAMWLMDSSICYAVQAVCSYLESM
jgi:hypothetical protein